MSFTCSLVLLSIESARRWGIRETKQTQNLPSRSLDSSEGDRLYTGEHTSEEIILRVTCSLHQASTIPGRAKPRRPTLDGPRENPLLKMLVQRGSKGGVGINQGQTGQRELQGAWWVSGAWALGRAMEGGGTFSYSSVQQEVIEGG